MVVDPNMLIFDENLMDLVPPLGVLPAKSIPVYLVGYLHPWGLKGETVIFVVERDRKIVIFIFYDNFSQILNPFNDFPQYEYMLQRLNLSNYLCLYSLDPLLKNINHNIGDRSLTVPVPLQSPLFFVLWLNRLLIHKTVLRHVLIANILPLELHPRN